VPALPEGRVVTALARQDLVDALRDARAEAKAAGEEGIVLDLDAQIERLSDPVYALVVDAREAVRAIDRMRYYHGSALSSVKLSPTTSTGLGEHGDELLANIASKLTQGIVTVTEQKGWAS
jgi:hypothetical protein